MLCLPRENFGRQWPHSIMVPWSFPHRSWGYFQRRMQLRREADDACSDGVNTAATDSSEWRDVAKPQSSYGETSAVWR